MLKGKVEVYKNNIVYEMILRTSLVGIWWFQPWLPAAPFSQN